MRSLRCFAIVVLVVGSVSMLPAQKEQRQPLSDAQIEAIREAGIDPNHRIELYTRYVQERADTIKGLTNRVKSASRAKRLDDELQDMTALMDELGSNLDEYSDRKADLRAALKKLNEAAPKWSETLRVLAGEPGFDEARKEAIESSEDLAGQAHRLLTEQTDYFSVHKEERGQQRSEPREPQ